MKTMLFGTSKFRAEIEARFYGWVVRSLALAAVPVVVAWLW